MKVIDLATTKALLGLTDTTYDTQITAQIPIIDAKVKQICRHNFNTLLSVEMVDGSLYVKLLDSASEWMDNELMTGTMLEGAGITTGTYVDEVYKDGYNIDTIGAPYFQLSVVATEDASLAYIYAGINKAYQSIIAKGIWWLIDNTSTNIVATDWTSRSGATLSVSRSEADNKIDGKSGMPAWFVKGLPRYHG